MERREVYDVTTSILTGHLADVASVADFFVSKHVLGIIIVLLSCIISDRDSTRIEMWLGDLWSTGMATLEDTNPIAFSSGADLGPVCCELMNGGDLLLRFTGSELC